MKSDSFGAAAMLDSAAGSVRIFRLNALAEQNVGHVDQLPVTIKVLLESALRNLDGYQVYERHIRAIASWDATARSRPEVPFKPGRVLLQDFTGVPAVVDLAALRDAMKELGGDPKKINPQVPCDLVIDHSVQTDAFGSDEALQVNVEKEFERNRERYEFLRWGQKAFDNFRVVPPATGIVHQVNLEYLAGAVLTRQVDGQTVAMPDSLVGTDSHTTMINGLGVLGWGVGGIEAEAVMLGQPLYLLLPDVVGVELTGELPEGATATDMVLRVTQMLRQHGVVDKFVEFFGDGVAALPLPDRATIANMGPEYGATCGFFPIDDETINYLRLSGRDPAHVDLVERYCKEQGLWREQGAPVFSQTLKLDLSGIEPALAGPKRPQDRVKLSAMQRTFKHTLRAPHAERGYALSGEDLAKTGAFKDARGEQTLQHGAVAIASITSCTNTSNPSVMIGAGLLAKKAAERGLRARPWVKTSLAPGSRVVTEYLDKLGLTRHLNALGFQTVGYGCLTCIGNSGPLPQAVADAVSEGDLVAASVLSGNRNFEGRVHPQVKANYLASPPLVVAYALAGTVDIDLPNAPLGKDDQGRDVYLRDIWPTQEEVRQAVGDGVTAEMFSRAYDDVFSGGPQWQAIEVPAGEQFAWKDDSTYIQRPPFFDGLTLEPPVLPELKGARVLAVLGDSVTTDHISPAGVIPLDSPAAKYLMEQDVEPGQFNSFGARRGNDRVMTRGTFGNIRLRNLLAPGTEGGVTRLQPDGRLMSIYEAAQCYRERGVPMIVLAGKEYGTGSSRDWAAKGPALLGVRAVIAESFERIHRSNLVGMGVLPLQLEDDQTRQSLQLDGTESYDIEDLDGIKPGQDVEVCATRADGTTVCIKTRCRIDTPVEADYYRNGGILQTVLRQLAKA